MLLFSTVSVMFLNGGLLPFVGVVMFVIFYYITRIFYNYLRNDDKYKNNSQISSDMPGEKYYIKGESDSKKLFIVIWLMVILILISVSLYDAYVAILEILGEANQLDISKEIFSRFCVGK